MGNLSIGQFLILIIICVLMFGDLTKIIKNIKLFFKDSSLFTFLQKKNRKKGS
jgi:hypothetical protein